MKNIIEYGTGVNRNPTLQYYNDLNIRQPYTEYCEEMYNDFLVGNGIVLRNELWEHMTPERRVYVINHTKGIDGIVSYRVIQLALLHYPHNVS